MTYDLKPGGRTVDVTDENKYERFTFCFKESRVMYANLCWVYSSKFGKCLSKFFELYNLYKIYFEFLQNQLYSFDGSLQDVRPVTRSAQGVLSRFS